MGHGIMERGWFHCGRCGELFQSSMDEPCERCGEMPVVGDAEIAFAMAGSSYAGEGNATHRKRRENQSGPAEKTGSRKGVFSFVVIWILLLGSLVGIVAWTRSQKDTSGADEIAEEIVSQSDRNLFLTSTYEKSLPVLMGFLVNTTPEARAEFVIDPVQTMEKMTSMGEEIPVLSEDAFPQAIHFDSFDSPRGVAIESVWLLPEGERLEAVFYKQDQDGWLLDWEQMVRYSTQPWTLFLSGDGPSIGEFRVLARRRAEFGGNQVDVSSLMLLGPRALDPTDSGAKSPEVVVDPASTVGIQLAEAFALKDEGKTPYDTQLSSDDIQSMIRIRAKIRRSEEKNENGDWDFTIEKILATHWMSFEDGEEK